MRRSRSLGALALGGALLVGAGWAMRRYGTTSLGPALRSALTEAAEVAAAVRHGMTEREGELRVALGLDVPNGRSPLDPGATRARRGDPAAPRGAPAGS